MKVILLDYVYKQGVAGEVIDVANGYARNYLIPQGLAVKATQGELKRAKKLREQAAAKRAALENRLNELAEEIEGVELIFGRRAAVTGKLFGSVTTQEIADALLEKTGVDINRRRISQQGLREIGTHDVPVRLGTDNSPVLKVTIVREEEMAEFLAKRAAEVVAESEDQTAEDLQEAVQELAEEIHVSSEALAEALEEAAETAEYAAENIIEAEEDEDAEAEDVTEETEEVVEVDAADEDAAEETDEDDETTT